MFSTGAIWFYKLGLKIIVFIKFGKNSPSYRYHGLKLWEIIREEENECSGSFYLTAISDAGCKIDLVISLTSFDA